jgi:hypothetical protein
MKTRWLIISALAGVTLLVSACFFAADKPHAMERGQVKRVSAPVKAHLRSGTVVLFPDGFEVRANYLFPNRHYVDDPFGNSRRVRAPAYDLARAPLNPVDSLALDSVAFLEYYRYQTDGTFIATLPGVTVGTVGIAKALFGSCPTVYTSDGETELMEAECFSYSIAPRFEGDDLDRLDHGVPRDGKFELKLTNEAFETHYINSLNLVAVDHDAACEAFPTPKEKIVLFGPAAPLISARNLAGHDIRDLIAERDGIGLESDSSAIAALAAGAQMEDGITLEFAVPEGARRMVVACKLRASLMNTVFFYEKLIGSQGLAALDWMRPSLFNLYRVWRLSKWYAHHFGMRVQLPQGNTYEDAATIVDVGPIVWRNVAVELPAPRERVARLRLVSLPGNWIVDWVGVSFDPPHEMTVTEIPPASIGLIDGTPVDQLSKLLKRDQEYFITFPGDEYRLSFDVPPTSRNQTRSYFLRSRGYYIEWLRQGWIAQAASETPEPLFETGTPVLRRTAQEWLARRPAFEAEFFASRIGARKGVKP